MPAPPPPLPLSSQFGPYGVFMAPPGAPAAAALDAGDRVGGPPPRRRRRLVRRLMLLGLAGGATWLLVDKREDVTALATVATAALYDLQQARSLPRPAARDAAKLPEPDPQPLAEREIAPSLEAPMAPAPTARAPEPAEAAPASAPPAEAHTDAPGAPERLPPVAPDPADPLQRKALAAGLHPDLSRALLGQLTPEDFRNAAHAVQAVLRGEGAAGPFVWPRQRAPQRAQFKVRLVAGAPAECRRYVVQIAKDGWETTARPMERCDARQAFKPS